MTELRNPQAVRLEGRPRVAIGIPQRFRPCIGNAELPHPHKDMHDDIPDDDPYQRGR
jgi:hypothetical protein